MERIRTETGVSPDQINLIGLPGIQRNNTKSNEPLNSEINLNEFYRVMSLWELDEGQRKYVASLYNWFSGISGSLSNARKILQNPSGYFEAQDEKYDVRILRHLLNSQNAVLGRLKPYR